MTLNHATVKLKIPQGSDVEDYPVDEYTDRPRVSQWVDEEELDEHQSGDESLSELSEAHSNSNLVPNEKYGKLEKDLSKLPFDAIVKARKAVRKTEETSSSSSEESDSDPDLPSESEDLEEEGAEKKSKESHQRSSKHAPVELSSKRPVTRRRKVVEVHRVKARDPRFLGLSGSLDVNRYRSQYGFLSDMHKGELSTLKASLTRARKLLPSTPRHMREDREKEIERLEKATKHLESVVNRERQQQVENEALKKLKIEEKEKQKSGKGAWWIKKSDEKDIRQRARLDALAESGGKRAVKKAIEKKQRKIGQKEKKSRPFSRPRPRTTNSNSTDGSTKRRDSTISDSRSAKRPRLSR